MIRFERTLRAALLVALLALPACTQKPAGESLAQLEEGFANPPREARPYLWWHWMNGNITKDGIRKDLLWMDSIGIGGFHHFDAAIGVPQIVEKRLIYMKDDWKDAFKYAIALGDSLGMEMTVASSPGWSCTGGPWVTPDDAMKKLVWRTSYLKGGETFSGKLPEPFDTPGRFQNLPTGGYSDPYYRDIAVLALKVPAEDIPLSAMDAKVTSSGGTFTLEQLSNEDLADGSILPEDKKGFAWIAYEFPEPVSFRAVSTMDSRTRNWPYLFPASLDVSLEKSDDGVNYTEVVKVPSTSCTRSTVSFPEARAKFFRLKVNNTGRPGSVISEFNLYPVGRVHHAEEKAGFCAPHDIHDYPTETDGSFASEVRDLTADVKDGVLTWDVPEGNWKVLRIGYSLTGHKNGPAPEEATGLEVDKLDPGAWSRYFHNYLDMYKEATGGLIGERGIQYILTDSYEAGCQNWTPTMVEEFRQRRGYDLTPWLPVLTGEIVESVQKSEAFLRDWTVTIADLYAANYDRINGIVKEYGMKGRYSEAHECGRVYIADGMDVKRTATVPMAACWIDAGSASMAAADIRESASVAHIYGQNLVAAESLTAHGTSNNAYSYSPRVLKHMADWEMANGVNRFVIHESAHQPLDSLFPGLGLGPYGQWFNRHETWAGQAKAWTDYLARSCYMLQRGKAVADILVYYGEDSNVCGEVSVSEMPGFIPKGYNYDYAGPTVVKDLLKVKDGRLEAGGMEYSVLYLDKNVGRMSEQVLARLAELAENGARICGHTPVAPAGMMDDEGRWNSLLERLKAGTNVHLEEPIGEVLASAMIQPDVEFAKEENINFVHRTLPGTDIYWINRPSAEGCNLDMTFRMKGRVAKVWHPETGKIEEVSYRTEGGRTVVSLDLAPDDAVFVVFSGKDEDGSCTVEPSAYTLAATPAGPWKVEFQEGRGAPASAVLESLGSLTESADPGIKYFSGRAVYTNTFSLGAVPEGADVVLDLGEVRDIAVVKVNGKECGTLWKLPYRTDISEAVKEGENTLEVTVVNPWHNRLVGDKQPDCGKAVGFTSYTFFDKDSPLIPSGLVGPVTIETAGR